MLLKDKKDKETVGEEIVVKWLKSHGFSHVTSKTHDNISCIEADSGMRRILVQVKILSTRSKRDLFRDRDAMVMRNLALQNLREAWTAAVVLDRNMQLSRSIKWYNLSKIK